MRIAVTGGTGFIGSHFLREALASGHDVVAFRRSPYSKTKIPIPRQPLWLDRQLDEVSPKDLKGSDTLLHLAAHSVQYPFDSLISCLQWNLIAVIQLFEQARDAGIQNFILIGSCFEYGLSGERHEKIPPSALLEPTNSYAASKAAASIVLSQWAREHGLNLSILRLFHVYGEGESPTRFWPSLKKSALAGEDFLMTRGEQVRDFTDVKLVAKLLLQEINSQSFRESSLVVKNLGSGNPCTLKEFAEHWWSTWGATGQLVFGAVPYRDDEVMSYVPLV